MPQESPVAGTHCPLPPLQASSPPTEAGDPPARGGIWGARLRLEPLSQSFFRGYGSILPTSLTCLLPLTRAFSARGPDADVVRPSATITLSASISGTSPGAPNRPESDLLCHLQHSVAPDKRISRSCRGVSRRRENSSWGPGWRHWRRLRCRHSMRALVPEY